MLDNNSADRTKEKASVFGRHFDVRVLDWKLADPDYQLKAYDFVVQKFGFEFEWIAFFDTDEFLIFNQDYDLRHVLSERTDADGIAVPWSVFGSSGYLSPPPGLTSENFLYRSEANFGPNRHIKSIVRPTQVKSCLNPHIFDISGAYRHLDGQEVSWESPGIVASPPSYEVAKLNHYFTRSFADWKKKMARGYHDIIRQISDFEAYDRNEVYDDTALSVVPTVKEILRKLD